MGRHYRTIPKASACTVCLPARLQVYISALQCPLAHPVCGGGASRIIAGDRLLMLHYCSIPPTPKPEALVDLQTCPQCEKGVAVLLQ